MNLPLIGDGIHAMWDIRLVFDMFVGGLGAAAVLLSVLFGAVTGWSASEKLRRAAYVLGAVGVFVGMLLVASELTHPERIPRVFLSGRISSPIVWGAFAQLATVLLCIVGAVLNRSRTVAALAALMSAVVVTYHGSFLAAMGGRPAWPLLVVFLFWLTAIASGAAALAIASALSRPQGSADDLRAYSRQSVIAEWSAVILGLVASLATCAGVYLLSVSPSGGREVDALVASLTSGELMLPMVPGVLITGVLGFLAVLAGRLMSGAKKDGRAAPIVLPLTGAVLVLASGFFIRYVVLAAGQSVPLLPI